MTGITKACTRFCYFKLFSSTKNIRVFVFSTTSERHKQSAKKLHISFFSLSSISNNEKSKQLDELSTSKKVAFVKTIFNFMWIKNMLTTLEYQALKNSRDSFSRSWRNEVSS